MDLSNVTVIIPAHNRPERLRRLLDYYRPANIQVIVSDSSHEVFKDAEEYPHIVYRHYPDMEFLQKIHNILPLIQTPYVFYCADDDFIVPEAVEQITSFLDMHPDYCTAQGHYLTFEVKKKKVKFTPRYIRNFDKEIKGENASARLSQYRNIYASNLYSVIRTETFCRMYKACFDESGNLRFRNLFLAEEYFNIFSLIHGNYITLPVFYSARERIPESATYTTVPFSVVMNSESYQEEYSQFISILANELVRKDHLSPKEATQRIHNIINMPKVDNSISFKQKIFGMVENGRYTAWIGRLLYKRYEQKGLKAVKGMSSYPCKGGTKETDAIKRCIWSTER